MASYHLTMKHGGKTIVKAHADYIAREGKYRHGEKAEELAHVESGNMPAWAERPRDFWEAAGEFERANGTAYREFEIALPNELTREQNIELVREFCKEQFGETNPYTFAIHEKVAAIDGEQKNPHAHIMFSQRALDGIERDREQFFKQGNNKNPERGGARAEERWNGRERNQYLRDNVRPAWARQQNEALERHGHEARVDHRSNQERGIDRTPERHLGAKLTGQMNRELREATKGIEDQREHFKAWNKYYDRPETNEKAAQMHDVRLLKITDKQIGQLEQQRHQEQAQERGGHGIEAGPVMAGVQAAAHDILGIETTRETQEQREQRILDQNSAHVADMNARSEARKKAEIEAEQEKAPAIEEQPAKSQSESMVERIGDPRELDDDEKKAPARDDQHQEKQQPEIEAPDDEPREVTVAQVIRALDKYQDEIAKESRELKDLTAKMEAWKEYTPEQARELAKYHHIGDTYFKAEKDALAKEGGQLAEEVKNGGDRKTLATKYRDYNQRKQNLDARIKSLDQNIQLTREDKEKIAARAEKILSNRRNRAALAGKVERRLERNRVENGKAFKLAVSLKVLKQPNHAKITIYGKPTAENIMRQLDSVSKQAFDITQLQREWPKRGAQNINLTRLQNMAAQEAHVKAGLQAHIREISDSKERERGGVER